MNQIIQAAKNDQIVLEYAIECASGNLKDIVNILYTLRDKNQKKRPKISFAPFSMALLWYTKLVPGFFSGVDVEFIDVPSNYHDEVSYLFREWLTPKLVTREVVPSPRIQFVPN
jgi:hypothetical protein